MPDTPVETAVVQTSVTVESDLPMAAPVRPTPPEALDSQQQPRSLRSPQKRATCPDPGSLYDILRENCGTSLFVLPILWTDVHPRLLRAAFVAQDPVLSPVPSTTNARSRSTDSSPRSRQPRPSELAKALSYDLTSLLSPEDTRPFGKARAIKSVLSTLFPSTFSRPKSVAELDLHFGGRVFRGAVRVPVFWKSPDAAGSSFDSSVTRPVSSFGHAPNGARETNDFGFSSDHSSQGSSDGPVVAYVNRSHLSLIRQNLFRIVPGPEDGDHGNTPVSRLQSLRSKQLMPSERDRDAYLMGVFLGMAQAHFYESSPSRMASQMLWWNNKHGSDPVAPAFEFHDVKLRILTHDDESSDFIVYTTVVTADFLKRFAEPAKATRGVKDSGMKIEYTRVPVWPILGLKERLGKVLGHDLVGEVQEVRDLFCDDSETERDGNNGINDASNADGFAAANETAGGDANGNPGTAGVPGPGEERARRPGSRKRKRSARVALTEMLTATLEAESTGSSKAGTTVSVTSPQSPRGKRRQARSHSSSLAVF